MRLIFISTILPFAENRGGTSALPFHLLYGLMNSSPLASAEEKVAHNCIIYSFNKNGLSDKKIDAVANELGVKIRLLTLPRWYRWIFKFHLLFLRVFLKYPFVNYIKLPKQIVDEIKSLAPDLIWVNSEELSRITKQFPGIRRMQLGPDVESLYYYRIMSRRFVMNSVIDYWKCAMMYRKYARLERNLCTDDNFTYYAVGEADIDQLRELNPNVNCQFLRHPHYKVSGCKPTIEFHQPKIRLLIAGQYNLYMQQTADELMPYLIDNNILLKKAYTITFLGKGWERHVELLKDAGYEVRHISFAPSYIDEICKHDIQLTPITVGTGTKGKVLDALANGLLVLGTPFAMENIAVEHNKSCIIWHHASELPGILIDITENKDKYELIASAGRDAVLTEHNPVKIAKSLFSLYN